MGVHWKFHALWIATVTVVFAFILRVDNQIERRVAWMERMETNQAAIEVAVAQNGAYTRVLTEALVSPNFCMCPTAEEVSKEVWNSPLAIGPVAITPMYKQILTSADVSIIEEVDVEVTNPLPAKPPKSPDGRP